MRLLVLLKGRLKGLLMSLAAHKSYGYLQRLQQQVEDAVVTMGDYTIEIKPSGGLNWKPFDFSEHHWELPNGEPGFLQVALQIFVEKSQDPTRFGARNSVAEVPKKPPRIS